jgi:glycosyltransferase involved in cell wall biosynthesis
VTVYGTWPNQPPHVIPFFTSMMTAEQVRRAVEVAGTKRLSRPLRVLFSGRLVAAKRVDVLLEAVKLASERGVPLEVAIVGQGAEEAKLRAQAAQLRIEDKVNFVGALPFDEALRWYDWAHCLVLPSTHSEGWPKVIAEAMCSGLVCVAVRHGQVPTMLEGRGILVSEGTSEEFADALQAITHSPEKYTQIMQAASKWARQYSLEGLRDANAELLARFWGRDAK